MALIKVEAHGKSDNTGGERNDLTEYYAKQAVLTKLMILTNHPKDKYLGELKKTIIKYLHLGPDLRKKE